MKKDGNILTDHHIIPSSRGGRTDKTNIKRVPDGFHNAFHQVFENLTPAEIYDYLEEVWFNPRHSFISPAKWLKERGWP